MCWRSAPPRDALAPALRLPAVQQLFPSLRRLSLGERQKLRDVVGQLALADARIDVFECCLTLLLASSLYDGLEGGAQHGSASLLQEIDAIHVLFCVLARPGNRRPALAGRRLRSRHLRRAARAPAGVSRLDELAHGATRCARAPRAPAAVREEGAHRRAWFAASRTTARCRWRKASCCARCAPCCIVRCRPFWAGRAGVTRLSARETGAARRRESRLHGNRDRAGGCAAGGAAAGVRLFVGRRWRRLRRGIRLDRPRCAMRGLTIS